MKSIELLIRVVVLLSVLFVLLFQLPILISQRSVSQDELSYYLYNISKESFTQENYSSLPALISGEKFYADGRPMLIKGDTIVFHLDQQGQYSNMFYALLDIYKDFSKYSFIKKYAILPSSSYHITLFEGLTERSIKRKTYNKKNKTKIKTKTKNNSKENINYGLTLEQAIDLHTQRLQGFKSNLPSTRTTFKFRLDPNIRFSKGPLMIRLLPYDHQENLRLRQLRDQLASTLQIFDARHDTYAFHITLGYLLYDLNPQEIQEFKSALFKWSHEIMKKSPMITVGPPEFCIFTDMFAFHRVSYVQI